VKFNQELFYSAYQLWSNDWFPVWHYG